jgi:predicted lactoylglutathione lyase
MSAITSVILEGPDPARARSFYADALGVDGYVDVRASDAPTEGFRGFTMSVVVPEPATVDAYVGAALDAGATSLKPASKSFWGYGGAVRAPDGAVWTVATQAKRSTNPASLAVDDVVLLLGVADVKASKRFYVDRGLTVKRSFGGRYVEFEAAPKQVRLALYGRRALARNAGVPEDGSGSHRLVVAGDAGSFTDPDGFVWESAA